MSRQTNLRTMEKRIYDLEKNGGGSGGSVKWSDVTYKPFKTLDSNDFVVESDKLKLKSGGGGMVTPTMYVTNNAPINAVTSEKEMVNVLNLYKDGDVVKLKGGWKIAMYDEGSTDDVEEMTDDELLNAKTTFPFITEVEKGDVLTATFSDNIYTMRWESTDGSAYGESRVTRPLFISHDYNFNINIESNYDTIYIVVY